MGGTQKQTDELSDQNPAGVGLVPRWGVGFRIWDRAGVPRVYPGLAEAPQKQLHLCC